MNDSNDRNDSTDRNLLTAEEVSGILRIPLPTVYRLTQQSKIRAVKVGKHWRYRKEDIERYFQFGTDKDGMRSDLLPIDLLPIRNPLPIQRRAYPRINTNFKCSYSVELPPFKIINSLGIIKNLSAGGVFIVGDGVEIDDPISLDFVIEDAEIKAKGKVVRKTKEGMGIRFKSIDKKMQNRILEYAV